MHGARVSVNDPLANPNEASALCPILEVFNDYAWREPDRRVAKSSGVVLLQGKVSHGAQVSTANDRFSEDANNCFCCRLKARTVIRDWRTDSCSERVDNLSVSTR